MIKEFHALSFRKRFDWHPRGRDTGVAFKFALIIFLIKTTTPQPRVELAGERFESYSPMPAEPGTRGRDAGRIST
jgi:hypothetical protein